MPRKANNNSVSKTKNAGQSMDAAGLRRVLKILTPEELAAALNTSTFSLENWRKDGTGPTVTRLGRRVYYHEADVATWIAQNAEEPGSEIEDEGAS